MAAFASPDSPRSSNPYLTSVHSAISRRSSKDVALDHLQYLNLHANTRMSTESRRGSGDAGWSLNQGYSGSRRGSKDESLTTILITSQGSPARKSSSPFDQAGPGQESSARSGPPRTSVSGSLKHAPSAARNSVPSSRSHATSSATATTSDQTISTQPSSLAPTDDETTPPAGSPAAHLAEENPEAGIGPDNEPTPNIQTPTQDSVAAFAPSTPVPAAVPAPASVTTNPATTQTAKPGSPKVLSRMASDDTQDESNGRSVPRKAERGSTIRESRSRSKLRGLKFWKKKREVEGSGETASP